MSQVRAHTTDFREGKIIDRDFEVVQVAGRGSFSTVYRARQLSRKGRTVALKILHEGMQKHFSNHAGYGRNPYLKEQLLCQRLKSPAVCRVIKVGSTQAQRYYLATEWAPGETLQQTLKAHPEGMPVPQSLFILEKLGQTLSEMHELGMVHQDLKPDNVMVGRSVQGKQVVKVVDFGITKPPHQEERSHSREHLLVGTPAYMSPEQAAGETTTPKSDVFSLAALAYQMLSGQHHIQLKQRPPGASDYVAYLCSNAEVPSTPLTGLRGELDASIDRILAEALQRDPAKRVPTAESFLQAISLALRASSKRRGAWRPWRRNTSKRDA